MKHINILILAIFLSLFSQAQIIPVPIKQYVPVKDQLELMDGKWAIWTEEQFLSEAEMLSQQIRIHRDFQPKVNVWNGKDGMVEVCKLLLLLNPMITVQQQLLTPNKFQL